MKRQILMAGTAMLLSLAAFGGNPPKADCTKVCSAKCVCDTKKCSPETCKKTCTNCSAHSGKCNK